MECTIPVPHMTWYQLPLHVHASVNVVRRIRNPTETSVRRICHDHSYARFEKPATFQEPSTFEEPVTEEAKTEIKYELHVPVILSSLQELHDELKIPPGWNYLYNWSSITITKFFDENFASSFSLRINEHLKPSLFALNKPLEILNPAYQGMPEQFTTVKEVLFLLSALERFNMCCGNNEEKFMVLQNSNFEIGEYFSQTKSFHSKRCFAMVENKRCGPCTKFRLNLRVLLHNRKSRTYPKSTKIGCLPLSILQKRVKERKVQAATDKQTISRLRAKIRALTGKEFVDTGVAVESDHSSFCEDIMNTPSSSDESLIN